MKCLEKNCNGRIDKQFTISLKTSCTGWGGSYSPAHACEKCGRLYWKNGKPVFNLSKNKVFLKNKKLVIQKK